MTPTETQPPSAGRRSINLALQGGGAHGAFTWGVLDRLLAEPRLQVEGVSGTSAGAMNAVVLAEGMRRGGPQGARRALARFWEGVSEAARHSPVRRSPLDVFMGNWSLDTSPSYLMLDVLSRLASPYDLNPLNINPLRELVAQLVDFEAVRSCREIKLFLSATNVHTGRVRVFHGHEVTADVVMASACLPFLFQAVEIDGVPYWDGGYMGNPALFPFFRRCHSHDVVIVQINPIERRETPRSAREILNRVNEITFNGSLLRELRAIDFVDRQLAAGCLPADRYVQVRCHMVSADSEIKPLGASSKMNAEWTFLQHLFAIGQEAADHWLDRNFDHLGRRSTLDLRRLFQGPEGGDQQLETG